MVALADSFHFNGTLVHYSFLGGLAVCEHFLLRLACAVVCRLS